MSLFNYKKYRHPTIDLQTLDKLIDLALVSPTSKFNAIVSGAKLLLVAAFLIARAKLIDQELEIQKQEYERERRSAERDDLEDI